VRRAIEETGTLEVPLHLRNAPTKLMKGLGYGAGYQYDHDVAGGVALDQQLLPDALVGQTFYQPTEHGLEAKIREKLMALRGAREAASGAASVRQGAPAVRQDAPAVRQDAPYGRGAGR
jgi:putative ATPase